MTLLRWLTCLLRSLTVSITVLLFWIYLFLLMLVLVLQGVSFLWEILMKLSRFPLTFLQTLKGMTLFFTKLITILVLIGTVFKIIWEMFNGRLSLNLGASAAAAATELCKWVQVGVDVYIPHRKCQVKPHSSPWFSATCAAVIAPRNDIFHLQLQNYCNLLDLK